MHVALYLIIWLISSGYAICSGGKPERLGTTILLFLSGSPLILHRLLAISLVDRGIAYAVIDILALPACIYLALSNRRHWTIWFCSAQLVAVLSHAAYAALSQEDSFAYWIMTRSPSYVQCIALILGTVMHHRKTLQRDGSHG